MKHAASDARDPPPRPRPAPVPAWSLAVGAVFAVALPTLIAFNVAPSATFFNQAAAFVGWGGFLIVLAALPAERRPGRARAARWRCSRR